MTYWGGKQTMLKHILPLIPDAYDMLRRALLWRRFGFLCEVRLPRSVLSTTRNKDVINFYQVLRSPRLRERLYAKLRATPYARSVFLEAIDIFFNPASKCEVERDEGTFYGLTGLRPICYPAITNTASSWSMLLQQKGAGLLAKSAIWFCCSWARVGASAEELAFQRKVDLAEAEAPDLRQIENRDAMQDVYVAAKSEDCFIYADPPIHRCRKGHNSGYWKPCGL